MPIDYEVLIFSKNSTKSVDFAEVFSGVKIY